MENAGGYFAEQNALSGAKPPQWRAVSTLHYASYATNCDVKTAAEKLFRRKK